MRAWPPAAEIVDLACHAAGRGEFRAEVLRRLERTIGCDGGWFHSMDPSAPLGDGVFRGMDLGHVERARAGWITYQAELGPMLSVAGRAGVVRLDEVFSLAQRDRLGFVREVARPLRMEQSLWIHLPLRGQVSSLGLFREDQRRGFPVEVAAALRPLVGVLALADRALCPPSAMASPALSCLSPREQQVVELLALGYRNREIALALGSSPLTVRNQLAAIFRKVGATTRAELVGLVLSAAGALPREAPPRRS